MRTPMSSKFIEQPLLPRADHFLIEIGAERLGDYHGAILLLEVFDDGDPGAADGERAAVEGVGVLGLLTSAHANAGAAGLEGFVVGAGGDFLVGVLAGEPDFDVVGFGVGEAEIAGGEDHGAERQAEAAEDVFGIGGERSEERRVGKEWRYRWSPDQ